ncbi:MAG: cysteine--tRNA ligase [Firmicutes bacterium]|nr:cysteine--tRNA ligase [Bacillota bacterium]
MRIYNSLTRKVEDFIPKSQREVKLYTCGPTVYHYAHIGNLRSYIYEDILEKSLLYLGFNVNRVMNITDVGHLTSDGDTGDDKMLKGAKREKKTILEIADYYTQEFRRDFESLHLTWPKVVVPATNEIEEYIRMIKVLEQKGFTYFAGGNVYFDTSKIEYPVLIAQSKEDLTVASREGVEVDEHKKNQADFVLWFTKSKFDDQELKWQSPWGLGYPGWHIECSAIAIKYLGDYCDIHCGGIDNKFPHHENEIAQSEAYLGKKWCSYWMHGGHLNDQSGKMSKSKGDFLTVDFIKSKGYSPEHYKYFCLKSYYRNQLVFTYEGLSNAKNEYDKLVKKLRALKEEGKVEKEQFEIYNEQFKDALRNDLNTSLAITAMYDVLKADVNNTTKRELITNFDKVLGLGLTKAIEQGEQNNEQDVDLDFIKEINEKIEQRNKAKKEKDFATADKIRDQLKEKGVTLIDSKDGTDYIIE